jgi:hypothetical protein
MSVVQLRTINYSDLAESLGLPPGATLTKTALTLPADVPLQQWKAIGKNLHSIGESAQWWIGDWWNSNTPYGKRVGLARDLGLNPKTVREYAYVAKSINVSMRMDTLSFAHHQVVAPLAPADQSKWLGKAQKNKWNSKELGRKVQKPRTRDDGQDDTVDSEFTETLVKIKGLISFCEDRIEKCSPETLLKSIDPVDAIASQWTTLARKVHDLSSPEVVREAAE